MVHGMKANGLKTPLSYDRGLVDFSKSNFSIGKFYCMTICVTSLQKKKLRKMPKQEHLI